MPDTDLNDAISSAVAEATTETAPEPDKPEAPTPEAPEPQADAPKASEKVEAKDTDEEEEFYAPTAEELDLIEKNPALQKAYKSFQRGFTKKAQTVAEKRKEAEQAMQVVEWIRSNPQDAIRQMAAAANINFAPERGETKQDAGERVTDELEEMWSQTVGPDAAKLLRPLIERTAEKLVEQRVAPLNQQSQQLARAATERTIAATVREFGAIVGERGEEWDDDIQGEMAKVATTLEPAEGATLQEYVSTLYDTVVARRMRAKQARSNLERLRRVRKEAEPVNTTRPTAPAEKAITNDMSDKDAVALAVRQAKSSLGVR